MSHFTIRKEPKLLLDQKHWGFRTGSWSREALLSSSLDVIEVSEHSFVCLCMIYLTTLSIIRIYNADRSFVTEVVLTFNFLGTERIIEWGLFDQCSNLLWDGQPRFVSWQEQTFLFLLLRPDKLCDPPSLLPNRPWGASFRLHRVLRLRMLRSQSATRLSWLKFPWFSSASQEVAGIVLRLRKSPSKSFPIR